MIIAWNYATIQSLGGFLMNTILVVVQTNLAIVILVSIMMQPSKADARKSR